MNEAHLAGQRRSGGQSVGQAKWRIRLTNGERWLCHAGLLCAGCLVPGAVLRTLRSSPVCTRSSSSGAGTTAGLPPRSCRWDETATSRCSQVRAGDRCRRCSAPPASQQHAADSTPGGCCGASESPMHPSCQTAALPTSSSLPCPASEHFLPSLPLCPVEPLAKSSLPCLHDFPSCPAFTTPPPPPRRYVVPVDILFHFLDDTLTNGEPSMDAFGPIQHAAAAVYIIHARRACPPCPGGPGRTDGAL